MIRRSLLPQDILDLADFFLNFAGSLFVFAFGFQLGILADFPGYLLDLALHFVKLAFCLVLCAGFHGIPPFVPGLTAGTLAPVFPVIKLLAVQKFPSPDTRQSSGYDPLIDIPLAHDHPIFD